MSFPDDDEVVCLVLLGAVCVCGVITGVLFGFRRHQAPWPRYLALTTVVLAFVSACTIVGLQWIRWTDYDRGIRASVESARAQGYEIQRSVSDDGTAVYKARNYIVPDGSFYYFANRSPFRPSWPSVVGWSLFSGIAAAVVSLIARWIARRPAEA